mmetsp:Transcript_44273/g.139669  ORF Transcript_44273/g.139669 Transcript_44273/m.139669 type:complete len:275 (+) Transcript_44273:922-1746(+)
MAGRSHQRRPVGCFSSQNSPADLSDRPRRHARAQGGELVAVGVSPDLRAAAAGDSGGGRVHLLPVLQRVNHQHLLLRALPPFDLRAPTRDAGVEEVLVHGGDAVRSLRVMVTFLRSVEGHVRVIGEDRCRRDGLGEPKRIGDDGHGDALRFHLHPPHVSYLTKVLAVLALGLNPFEDHVRRHRVLLTADVPLAGEARLCTVHTRIIVGCSFLLIIFVSFLLLPLLLLLCHHTVRALVFHVWSHQSIGLYTVVDIWQQEACPHGRFDHLVACDVV